MAQKRKKITVTGAEIIIQTINNQDYISLTDMANWDNNPNAKTRIRNWLKNRSTIEFLALWEDFHNPDFNYAQMDVIRKELGLNSYIISPKKWIAETGAIGILSRAGRYGGTYAHKHIAFEFASWLSPSFKFCLITEFDRLKTEEYNRQKLEWNYQRFLAKVNYKLHTDTIKEVIIPRIQQNKTQTPDWLIYAEEADLLNMAVFGMTAKQWREENPELAKEGNIRDHAELVELNVLANIESMNAILIERGISKEDRFQILAEAAISQYSRLAQHYSLKQVGE